MPLQTTDENAVFGVLAMLRSLKKIPVKTRNSAPEKK